MNVAVTPTHRARANQLGVSPAAYAEMDANRADLEASPRGQQMAAERAARDEQRRADRDAEKQALAAEILAQCSRTETLLRGECAKLGVDYDSLPGGATTAAAPSATAADHGISEDEMRRAGITAEDLRLYGPQTQEPIPDPKRVRLEDMSLEEACAHAGVTPSEITMRGAHVATVDVDAFGLSASDYRTYGAQVERAGSTFTITATAPESASGLRARPESTCTRCFRTFGTNTAAEYSDDFGIVHSPRCP